MCPRKGLEGQKGRSIPQNAKVKGEGEDLVSSRGSPVRMLGDDGVVGQDFSGDVTQRTTYSQIIVQRGRTRAGEEQGGGK
jgi:hypothetical protein